MSGVESETGGVFEWPAIEDASSQQPSPVKLTVGCAASV